MCVFINVNEALSNLTTIWLQMFYSAFKLPCPLLFMCNGSIPFGRECTFVYQLGNCIRIKRTAEWEIYYRPIILRCHSIAFCAPRIDYQKKSNKRKNYTCSQVVQYIAEELTHLRDEWRASVGDLPGTPRSSVTHSRLLAAWGKASVSFQLNDDGFEFMRKVDQFWCHFEKFYRVFCIYIFRSVKSFCMYIRQKY